ncbi:hypothetical protein Tco_1442114, partial [Tanacetum coccineum]
SDKDILASYGDTITLKRRRDDEDEDEEPSARSNRGSKRRRARKELESTSALKEKTSKSTASLKKGPNLIKHLLAMTKTKAPDYGHIKWIEDLVPNSISIVIRRSVEDIQLGIKSYQKKLNFTKLDTYRSDLKRKTPFITYSNPKGFIYQNKDKKNKLICIDKLHKFSDDTLNDVRSALDDILKRIQMEYLPQTVWRNVDKERARAMI